MRIIGTLAISLALAACTQVQQFTERDVSNAATIAIKSGDAQGGACWTALGGALMPSPDPASDGLAVLVERKRLLDDVAIRPCAPVILPFILQLGQLGLKVAVPGL